MVVIVFLYFLYAMAFYIMSLSLIIDNGVVYKQIARETLYILLKMKNELEDSNGVYEA